MPPPPWANPRAFDFFEKFCSNSLVNVSSLDGQMPTSQRFKTQQIPHPPATIPKFSMRQTVYSNVNILLNVPVKATTHEGFCSRSMLQEQSSSVCTNDFMDILHPRVQNFHPAKCSTTFNRLNTLEQAPGANNAPSCVLTRAK